MLGHIKILGVIALIYIFSIVMPTSAWATEAPTHEYGEEWVIDRQPTCTVPGSQSRHCIYCGAKGDITVIPATDHQFDEWIENTIQTCTVSGDKSRTCLSCGYEEHYTLPALGHSFEQWVDSLLATCISDGLSERTCNVCNFSEEQIIPSTGHEFSEWEMRIPTCTEDGYKRHDCLVCGDVETEELLSSGHRFSDEWTIDVAATCITDGEKSRHCLLCSERADKISVPHLEHDFASPSGQEGEENQKACRICGMTDSETEEEQTYASLIAINLILATTFSLWIVPDIKILMWYAAKKNAFFKGR